LSAGLTAGWLKPDAASRAGDAAFLHRRVDNDQEIEIEGTPIH
jgi:hypothetical protein